jgi:hypothetical protein
MFVRNHHPVPVEECDKQDRFAVTVKIPVQTLVQRGKGGKDDEFPIVDGFKEVKYTVEDLKSRFKHTTVVTSIQCGGNRRSSMDKVALQCCYVRGLMVGR